MVHGQLCKIGKVDYELSLKRHRWSLGAFGARRTFAQTHSGRVCTTVRWMQRAPVRMPRTRGAGGAEEIPEAAGPTRGARCATLTGTMP